MDTSVPCHPILFKGPMVVSLMAPVDPKTNTRRLIEGRSSTSKKQTQPSEIPGIGVNDAQRWLFKETDAKGTPLTPVRWSWGDLVDHLIATCPHGKKGDHLWVRESLYLRDNVWYYKADDARVTVKESDRVHMLSWVGLNDREYCPSIHMPRWASRITLKINDVRIERLQDITVADIYREGIYRVKIPNFHLALDTILSGTLTAYKSPGIDLVHSSARFAMIALWDSINGSNPAGEWAANPVVRVLDFERINEDTK